MNDKKSLESRKTWWIECTTIRRRYVIEFRCELNVMWACRKLKFSCKIHFCLTLKKENACVRIDWNSRMNFAAAHNTHCSTFVFGIAQFWHSSHSRFSTQEHRKHSMALTKCAPKCNAFWKFEILNMKHVRELSNFFSFVLGQLNDGNTHVYLVQFIQFEHRKIHERRKRIKSLTSSIWSMANHSTLCHGSFQTKIIFRIDANRTTFRTQKKNTQVMHSNSFAN